MLYSQADWHEEQSSVHQGTRLLFLLLLYIGIDSFAATKIALLISVISVENAWIVRPIFVS